MEGHAALLRRVEQLTGKLPIVAISGHTESRGCTEPCSQEIIDAVCSSAAGGDRARNLVSGYFCPAAR